ncbi:hypothetical protein ACHAXS_004567 [Conticribra weissflogii]
MTSTSDDVAEAAVALTPSFSEGELTVSSPPPNRARLVANDNDDIIHDDDIYTCEQTSAATAKDTTTITKTATQPKPTPKPTPKHPAKTETKPSSDPRYFLAGGLSAAISHGIATPIDVVKTRMQTDASLSSLSPQDAASQICRRDGPSALTAGLGPTVVGYGIEGALKFGVYETLKTPFLSLFLSSSAAAAIAATAICAGAIASLVLCPVEETRIRLVADPTFEATGLWDGLPALLEREGPLTPFRRGVLPMLSKQVPYTAGKQVSFDVFAGMLYGWLSSAERGGGGREGAALAVEVGAAFLASLVACLASHPGDVLLTAAYKNSGAGAGAGAGAGGAGAGGVGGEANDDADAFIDGDGFGATIDKVYREGGGIAAFFRGLNARFFHVGCIITFQLVLYDQLKQVLGLPASGAH